MYVRVTTLHVAEGKLDRVLSAVRNQGIPALQALPGCRRIEILVDQESRTILYVSTWDRLEQAEGATTAKYRLEALARVEADLAVPIETAIYELVATG